MSMSITRGGGSDREALSTLTEDRETFGDLVRPLLAGARARGVADACDILGIAAVLLNGRGKVLHIGASARDRIGLSLGVIDGRLRATDPAEDPALQDLLAAVAGSLPQDSERRLVLGRGPSGALSLRALRVAAMDEGADQLLRIIVVIDATGPSPAEEPPQS